MKRYLLQITLTAAMLLSLLGSGVRPAMAQGISNISITIVTNQDKVKEGQLVTYTATMTNLGSDDAVFVDVGFALPDQLSLVSLTCDRGISPDTPFCEYSTLAAGETVVSILVATPTAGMQTHDRKVKLTANVFFEVDCSYDPNCTLDQDLSNNSAALTTTLIGKLAHP
jgi:uncharacterized repeat protein (TIGR01451 family)